jgi:CDP-diacylglycerol--serine O-phosphatidyltransferase
MKKIRLRKSPKRDQKRRPINVLASAITTFSLYLGLWSIFSSIREDYVMAASLILGAIVCDMMDGTVARMTKSISDFGKELDSLCDLVSFGVAPAVLIFCAYLSEEQMTGTAVGRTGSVMAIIFVICAALRLARFNVFQSAHRESFTGLPTPAAGGTIAAFVLFMNYYKLHVAFYVLSPMTIGLAYLMVSNVRYPKDRLKKVFVLAPRHAFRMLAITVVIIAVFHYAITHSPVIVLFPLSMAYVLFGVFDELLLFLKKRRGVAQASGSTEVGSPSGAENKGDLR